MAASLQSRSPAAPLPVVSRRPLSGTATARSLSAGASAQLDPVKNFCRRRLYIDGGLINYNPISQYPSNYSNLNTLTSSGMPQLYANLTKNSSIPDVSGGILWADDVNKRFYLFGGEYYQQPPTPFFTLWSYDALYDSVSHGAGVAISSRGEGYYYGGWVSNSSVLGWSGPSVATGGLIKYEMDGNTFTNNTGPDAIRRAEGAMVYIPVRDGGMLVYFGGIQDLYRNGTVTGQPMNDIYLYDVLSAKWYLRRFYAGATWAADQSSYNIYLYGGAGFGPNVTGFDDVYILTIPSFQWIKLCDAPDQYGQHNLDMGEQNPEKAPWQLFVPNLTTYAVPDPIIKVVGGDGNGGATKTVPANGFSDPDLKVLMTRKASPANRTLTSAVTTNTGSLDNSGKLSTGAIVGITVGAAALVILGIVGCCVFIRRHRRRRRRMSGHGQEYPGGAGISIGASPAVAWSSPHSEGATRHEGRVWMQVIPTAHNTPTGTHSSSSPGSPTNTMGMGHRYPSIPGGGGGGGGHTAVAPNSPPQQPQELSSDPQYYQHDQPPGQQGGERQGGTEGWDAAHGRPQQQHQTYYHP
ncbi:hypothetical protein QBC46DRAFT_364800 [Diplogelasinospora grovesii]|uniref:Cell wall anchored protein n=1 Tax=Diplogelasinospora grovesii TaxID=303347 RepID=A0AAN6N879_9PEZI|nr:hypothetical protein QBC46DRAFT_364800 [Diplogelasinospora grovesii]